MMLIGIFPLNREVIVVGWNGNLETLKRTESQNRMMMMNIMIVVVVLKPVDKPDATQHRRRAARATEFFQTFPDHLHFRVG